MISFEDLIVENRDPRTGRFVKRTRFRKTKSFVKTAAALGAGAGIAHVASKAANSSGNGLIHHAIQAGKHGISKASDAISGF